MSHESEFIAIISLVPSGFDPATATPIALAIVLVEVDEQREIGREVDEASGYIREVPQSIDAWIGKVEHAAWVLSAVARGVWGTASHGRRSEWDRMLLDRARAERLVARAQAVISDNMRFDAPIAARILPALECLPWLCARRDVPWGAFGFPSARRGRPGPGKMGELMAWHTRFEPSSGRKQLSLSDLMIDPVHDDLIGYPVLPRARRMSSFLRSMTSTGRSVYSELREWAHRPVDAYGMLAAEVRKAGVVPTAAICEDLVARSPGSTIEALAAEVRAAVQAADRAGTTIRTADFVRRLRDADIGRYER